MTAMQTVPVSLGDRSYEILIGAGLLKEAGARVRNIASGDHVFIVTDENVAGHYLDQVAASMAGAGFRVDKLVLPAGEQSKSFTQLEALVSAMLDAKIERRSLVVALGGGVIGDLAGFAASIVLRGVDFVQIPTSLLAQVDSSVGGKTAIDMRQGKNLVGAFYQPKLVLIDTDVLKTLPRRELLAGYAETVKYGLIGDFGFFEWCEEHGSAVVAGDASRQVEAIRIACEAKARVVSADERETGARALLNLGHTFGHALEAEAGMDGSLIHGEAVAIGMVMAFDLSAHIGLCPSQDAVRVRSHLSSVGLPVSLEEIKGASAWDPAVLVGHMGQDKKVEHGRINFILARGIGDAFITNEVEPAQLHSLFEGAKAA